MCLFFETLNSTYHGACRDPQPFVDAVKKMSQAQVLLAVLAEPAPGPQLASGDSTAEHQVSADTSPASSAPADPLAAPAGAAALLARCFGALPGVNIADVLAVQLEVPDEPVARACLADAFATAFTADERAAVLDHLTSDRSATSKNTDWEAVYSAAPQDAVSAAIAAAQARQEQLRDRALPVEEGAADAEAQQKARKKHAARLAANARRNARRREQRAEARRAGAAATADAGAEGGAEKPAHAAPCADTLQESSSGEEVSESESEDDSGNEEDEDAPENIESAFAEPAQLGGGEEQQQDDTVLPLAVDAGQHCDSAGAAAAAAAAAAPGADASEEFHSARSVPAFTGTPPDTVASAGGGTPQPLASGGAPNATQSAESQLRDKAGNCKQANSAGQDREVPEPAVPELAAADCASGEAAAQSAGRPDATGSAGGCNDAVEADTPCAVQHSMGSAASASRSASIDPAAGAALLYQGLITSASKPFGTGQQLAAHSEAHQAEPSAVPTGPDKLAVVPAAGLSVADVQAQDDAGSSATADPSAAAVGPSGTHPVVTHDPAVPATQLVEHGTGQGTGLPAAGWPAVHGPLPRWAAHALDALASASDGDKLQRLRHLAAFLAAAERPRSILLAPRGHSLHRADTAAETRYAVLQHLPALWQLAQVWSCSLCNSVLCARL